MSDDDERVMALDLPEADDDPGIAGYYAKCEERLGLVPNVLRAFATRPEKFRTFTAFYNELMLGESSGLSKLEREMIAVVVSSANRCLYCLVAHGQAVRKLSGDPVLGDQLALDHTKAALSERHRAMLDFAWKLAERPQAVDEADRERLRAAGFGEADIFDIADVAAFFAYSNRMAHALDLRPNREYYGMDR